ncbi:MAG: hypothetical protein Q9220_001174 [cf. Caloplaca sp. 1 TL-2023]
MDRILRSTSRGHAICAQCRARCTTTPAFLRPLSTSTPRFAEPPDQEPINIPESTTDAASTQQPTDQSASPSIGSTSSVAPDPTIQGGRPSILASIKQAQNSSAFSPQSATPSDISDIFSNAQRYAPSPLSARSLADGKALPTPHHLHVYSTKHNTHITLSNPDRNPVLSVSAGTIGFRKAARGTYDAAYQLGAYVMGRIQQQGLLAQIQYLEVVLRDYGPGREAVTKILLGSEGRNLRGRVIRVSDATRLKFGGTRSKKPRRLG